MIFDLTFKSPVSIYLDPGVLLPIAYLSRVE